LNVFTVALAVQHRGHDLAVLRVFLLPDHDPVARR